MILIHMNSLVECVIAHTIFMLIYRTRQKKFQIALALH